MISQRLSVLSFQPTFFRNIITTSKGKTASFSTLNAVEGSLKVGIFGGGVVGGGVVEILEAKKSHFQTLTGRALEVTKVCVKDASKDRDWKIPAGCALTTDYNDILEDDSIDLVVEVMGGTTVAKDVVFKAIQKGKNVVTANKALIAACLPEIEGHLQTVNSNNAEAVEFRYEAAVCGGIPIIRSMQSDFVGDEISSMAGIINGCTNFMLTAMDKKKQTYEDALAEASRLGYAEADPTLDVDGFDARSKLKILLRLAYGIDVEEEEISCRGITELTKVDFEYATMLGGTIKLVGVAKKVDEKKVVAFVSPGYISSDETLASVNGATNAIEILSKNLVASTYIGQGAGRWPTANSVVNDIISIAKADRTLAPFNAKHDFKFVNDFTSAFYIRIKYRDALGITRQCGEICEKCGVSIHSILQNPVRNRDDAAFAIITERVPLSSIKKVAAEIEGLDWCFGNVFYMPVLSDDFI